MFAVIHYVAIVIMVEMVKENMVILMMMNIMAAVAAVAPLSVGYSMMTLIVTKH